MEVRRNLRLAKKMVLPPKKIQNQRRSAKKKERGLLNHPLQTIHINQIMTTSHQQQFPHKTMNPTIQTKTNIRKNNNNNNNNVYDKDRRILLLRLLLVVFPPPPHPLPLLNVVAADRTKNYSWISVVAAAAVQEEGIRRRVHISIRIRIKAKAMVAGWCNDSRIYVGAVVVAAVIFDGVALDRKTRQCKQTNKSAKGIERGEWRAMYN
mmetsp:Transcript_2988/g.6578  ORF Transcript_2988/g.6578 Transcript_2988/m.6578 type:complete len:208 (-) Transcript_2988:32-655(-)